MAGLRPGHLVPAADARIESAHDDIMKHVITGLDPVISTQRQMRGSSPRMTQKNFRKYKPFSFSSWPGSLFRHRRA